MNPPNFNGSVPKRANPAKFHPAKPEKVDPLPQVPPLATLVTEFEAFEEQLTLVVEHYAQRFETVSALAKAGKLVEANQLMQGLTKDLRADARAAFYFGSE